MAKAIRPEELARASAGKPYVPLEIGSLLAKVSFRVIHLDHEITYATQPTVGRLLEWDGRVRDIQADCRSLQGQIRAMPASSGLEVRLRDLQGHCRTMKGRIRKMQPVDGGKWRFWYQRVRNTLFRTDPGPASLTRRAVRLFKKAPGVKPAVPAPEPLPAPAAGLYAAWIAKYEPGAAEMDAQRTVRFPAQPRISLVVPEAAASERFFRAMLDSAIAQTYGGWELCVAAPPGRPPVGLDPRVRAMDGPAASGWAETAARLLSASAGEYVAFLGPNDTLAPFALFEIVQEINHDAASDFFYSDEDRLGETGQERSAPLFKPDWSPDALRSHDYVGRLAVFSRALVDRAGGVRDGFGRGAHYDLVLRASEQAGKIVHVPRILYHRRFVSTPTAEAAAEQAAAKKSVVEHLGRLGWAGEVKDGPRPGALEVQYALPLRPLVSIVVPNRDDADMLARCVESVRRSSYPRLEIVVVENGSKQPRTFAYYEELRKLPNVRVHPWDRPFNYAAVNNEGVRKAKGEVLLFLNNDTESINEDFLERMLEHALRRPVGAVGAKLYYPDDTIQHAGLFMGKAFGPWHQGLFQGRRASGYANRLMVVQNVSGVTGACLMMRRDVFEEVGGFDETFAIAFNDLDLCFKVRQRGYVVVWTPHAELYHFESVTRGYNLDASKRASEEVEKQRFLSKWAGFLPEIDPYYTPNLVPDGGDGALRP